MPYIGKKPADIIATVIDTTTGTFSGEVDAGSLDVSGNADIDGITNLDNTDIDGTLDVSGNLTVDTNTLFVDSANNRVGVGTNSPELELHIKGSGNQSLRLETTDSTYIGFDIQQNSDGSGQILLRDSKPLIFYTNSSEAMRIDNNGNVGINTSSPNTTNLNSGTTSGIVVKSGGVAKNNFVALPSTGGSQWDVRESGGSGGEFSMRMFDTSGTHNVQISSNGNHFFNGGNVGIGTSSPANKLTIEGTTDASLRIDNTGDNTAELAFDSNRSSANVFLSYLRTFWNGTEVARMSGMSGTDTTNKDDGYLRFDVRSSGASLSEAMRIDSSGRVSIGTTTAHTTDSLLTLQNSSGSAELNITSSTSGGSVLNMGDTGDYNIGRIKYDQTTNSMQFNTNNAERMRIDSSGNVGIGTNAMNSTVNLYSSSSTQLQFQDASTGTASGDGVRIGYNGSGAQIWNFENNFTRFATNNTERMRIDSSGNVLVSKTAGGSGTAGIQLESGGRGGFTKDNAYVTFQNRLSSDGEISRFMKDGTTVGSIGTTSGDLYIASFASGHEGLRFGNGAIVPVDTTGASTDAACNLGGATGRFADLYLSGGAYLGGTGSANYLEDYEEGSWTPIASAGLSGFTVERAYYTKVGRLVQVNLYLSSLSGKNSNQLLISGLPFTPSNAYGFGLLDASPTGHVGIGRVQSTITSIIFYYANTSDAERENYLGNDLGTHMIFSVVYMTP
jgi:hypothetical protein